MRNGLAIMVLVALFGLIADVRQPAAQPLQGMAPPNFGPGWFQSPNPTRKAKPAPHHVAKAPAKVHKRHAVRPPPNQRKLAERKGYQRVSDLVNFPKFFPGLGIIYVKPDTLPLGPFLCFDREDRLVATVYMVPIKDIDDHKSFDAAAFGATAGPVDHVTIYFNGGHPGVDMPHYHIVLWHVTKKEESRVAQ